WIADGIFSGAGDRRAGRTERSGAAGIGARHGAAGFCGGGGRWTGGDVVSCRVRAAGVCAVHGGDWGLAKGGHAMMPALIVFGGICHFGILIASALLPRVLAWKTELRKLDPLSRHIVWVHGAFIVLTVMGFGVLSLVMAREMA